MKYNLLADKLVHGRGVMLRGTGRRVEYRTVPTPVSV